jgi:hypothetical protein
MRAWVAQRTQEFERRHGAMKGADLDMLEERMHGFIAQKLDDLLVAITERLKANHNVTMDDVAQEATRVPREGLTPQRSPPVAATAAGPAPAPAARRALFAESSGARALARAQEQPSAAPAPRAQPGVPASATFLPWAPGTDKFVLKEQPQTVEEVWAEFRYDGPDFCGRARPPIVALMAHYGQKGWCLDPEGTSRNRKHLWWDRYSNVR